ncbi:NADH-ubiquinone oxidoreductase 21 kDa subunit, mitochondrial [Smittium culicis]|uniref:NADH dehydrogenase [ubiquinone] iron-sulfur protein 4, mitochondrial n=1 Tax=Smittium culicis TaxID=133412 RepID=A0A1R1YJZ3_9FUNG|nr:NADH-ubiquinone oxidoreductase 21 kDa subunit, mitochondrial [Smittium culicis]
MMSLRQMKVCRAMSRTYSKIVVTQLVPSKQADSGSANGIVNKDMSEVVKRAQEIDVASCTYEGQIKNKVRIYRPAATPTQSGKDNSRTWKIDFDTLQFGNNWENQLVGWKGSANIMQSIQGQIKNKVRIYRPAATPTQSGKDNSRTWKIDFDTLQFGNNWENQLVGWKGSANIMQSIRMDYFSTKEEAIRFAEKHGWEYYVKEPKFPKFKAKSYKANFQYNPNELRFIYTK